MKTNFENIPFAVLKVLLSLTKALQALSVFCSAMDTRWQGSMEDTGLETDRVSRGLNQGLNFPVSGY